MDDRPRANPDPQVLAAFAAMVVFLGVNFVAVRFSNEELAPLWGAALRFALAAAVAWSLVTFRGIPLPRGRALVGAALFGALAFGLNFGLLYWALQWVPAGTAAVVFSTIPLTTFIVAVLAGLERFRLRGLFGAAIVTGGVASLFGQALAEAIPAMPLVLVVGASVAAALSGIVVKAFPRSHPLATNAVGMAVGFALLLGASVLRGEARTLPTLPSTWLAVAWLVTSSVVAFALMVFVITRWTASANAYGAVLSPLVTIPVAAALAGERVGLAFLASSLLVLWGVYVGALYRPRAAPMAGPSQASARPLP